jgi:hypothetical protein
MMIESFNLTRPGRGKSLFAALLPACLTLAFTCSTFAGQTHYTCIIMSASKLTGDGALASDWSMKPFLGQKFTVDRETGRIIGGPLENSKMRIQLIDKGSVETSFQVFAHSRQKSHTTHIQIEEFQGTESKPFVGTTTLDHPGVYSGTCK